MSIWNELYNAAVKVQNDRSVSPFIDAGGVAATILTRKGTMLAKKYNVNYVFIDDKYEIEIDLY